MIEKEEEGQAEALPDHGCVACCVAPQVQARALVLTNHMADLAGSELVALEVCESLLARGYDVTLHTNCLGEPLASLIDVRIHARADENFPDVFSFDFVWSQHHVLPLAIAQHDIPNERSTRFVSAHLAGRAPFELAGLPMAQALGAIIVSNSPNGARMLRERGVAPEIVVSYNACPPAFWLERERAALPLRRVLVVSNHVPVELAEAMHHLRAGGISVEHVGLGGDTVRRIMPTDMQTVDAVVTIGKTVQYALMGGVPVYCYDHVGGPGWLTEANFDLAEAANFSGCCCQLKKNAAQIADELVDGYADASAFVLAKRIERKERYSLEHLLDTLLRLPKPDGGGGRSDALLAQARTEAVFAALIRSLYIHHRNASEGGRRAEGAACAADQRAVEADQRAVEAGQRAVEAGQRAVEAEQRSCDAARQARQSDQEGSLSRQALAEAHDREGQLRDHIQSLTRSTSWRVTRPMRFLSRVLRSARPSRRGK